MRNLSFAVSAILLIVFADVGGANTAIPTVTGFGGDDRNTSTLAPYDTNAPNNSAGALYLGSFVNWFSSALNQPASGTAPVGWNFNQANQWTFAFANANLPLPGALNSFVYSAWVVNNDGYNLPNGNPAVPIQTTGDVGGANYTLNYTPGANNPGAGNTWAGVHFLQVAQVTSNYGNDQTGQVNNTVTSYFLDNNGSILTPWYDGNFSETGFAGLNNASFWLDDTPFRCENQGDVGTCLQDGTPNLLSVNWQAATYVAVDFGAGNGTQHQVVVYGGRNWGYIYSNDDAPEPAALVMSGAGLALLLARRLLGGSIAREGAVRGGK